MTYQFWGLFTILTITNQGNCHKVTCCIKRIVTNTMQLCDRANYYLSSVFCINIRLDLQACTSHYSPCYTSNIFKKLQYVFY